MYCGKCGKQIEGEAKFCPVCGTPVEAPVEKEAVAPAPAPVEPTPAPVVEQPAPTPVPEAPAATPTPAAPANDANAYNPMPNNYYAEPMSEPPKKENNNTLFIIVVAVLVSLIIALVVLLVIPKNNSNSGSSNGGSGSNQVDNGGSGSNPVDNGGNGSGTVTPVVNNEVDFYGVTVALPEGAEYEADDEGISVEIASTNTLMYIELFESGFYDNAIESNGLLITSLEEMGITDIYTKTTTIAGYKALVLSGKYDEDNYYYYAIENDDFDYQIQVKTSTSTSGTKIDQYIKYIVEKSGIKGRSTSKFNEYKSTDPKKVLK